MSTKYVYTFGDGKAEGKADMKNLLGGKGANLAEMNLIGLPVPAGFTITTEAVSYTHLDVYKRQALGYALLLQRTNRRHRNKIAALHHENERKLFDAKIGFFTHITHEIRTPVTLILAPVEEIMRCLLYTSRCV